MKIEPAVVASRAGSLAEALAGRKLRRFFGDYGYREHQTMTLCRNGRFFYNMEAGGVTRPPILCVGRDLEVDADRRRSVAG